MFLLIAIIVFGGAITYFAVQNTETVNIHLSTIQLTDVPLYWIILVSVLATLLFSWLIILLNSLSSSYAMRGKNNTVTQLKKENEELTKKVHQLELINARKEGDQKKITTETS